ncbi:MAG TPA: PilZ domain-containing protein [Terracidiphilus sp.]|nr:PilZ domain-containing protein [Terracidiphilus sp.]
MLLSKFFHKPSLGVQQRAERRPVQGLAAYYRSGMTLKSTEIRDISASGLFAVTSDRWMPGDIVSLILQREGPPERDQERRATVQAKCVWLGEDGVGFDFMMNEEIEFNLWDGPLTSASGEHEPEDIIREFRIAETLTFLAQIGPEKIKDLVVLFRKEFSHTRALTAVEIALESARTLTFRPDAAQLRIHPDLIMRIMEFGSWAEDASVRRFWSGLLIASCTIGVPSDENLVYVEPLSQLLSKHIRIFIAACTRARLSVAADGSLHAETTPVPFEEIIQITGARDISKNERDMAHLFLMGLLDDRKRALALLPVDEANLTPTPFGLELYARCKGHAGSIKDFYGVAAAEAPASAPASATALVEPEAGGGSASSEPASEA